MRAALIMLCALVALAGCTASGNGDRSAVRSDTRQVPTALEPGLRVSGYATVGVARTY
ncbi:hypothetical protein [Sulfitobacter brevis]|nr:hypothetical protein [Sulfitobacter brevis]